MRDKKKKNLQEQTEPQVKEQVAPQQHDASFIPNEQLQTYYNEAYINERERLNAMFGRIDAPVIKKEIIYRDPDLSEYVHISKYKKKATCAAVLGMLFAIATVAAGVLAYLKFFA